MNSQYLSIQEASNVTWKHINTIRGLIEKNKVQHTKDGKRYLILRESLSTIYKDKKEEIENFWTKKEWTSTNSSNNNHSTSDINNQLKPLIESLQYQLKQNQETQKLLTSSKEETLKIKTEYEDKLQSQKATLEDEKIKVKTTYEKKMFTQKIIIYILWAVLLFLLLVILMVKWVISINLS